MSMKITPLHTYWTAEEAHTVIEFLEVLHHELWEIYGDMVIDMLRETSADTARHEDQIPFDFNDEIEF